MISKFVKILLIGSVFTIFLVILTSFLPPELSWFSVADTQTILDALTSIFNFVFGFISPLIDLQWLGFLLRAFIWLIVAGFTIKIVIWLKNNLLTA